MGEGNETAAWQRWLDDHASRFLLFARQKARCEADAEDLVQEAVIEAVRRCGSKGPPESALVFATIQRRAIDWARKVDRRTMRENASAEGSCEPWFDTTVEERERARLVQDAVARLPGLYREVLTLKIWGELTFEEIGKVLSIPANTAASRYRYGLEELRKLMKAIAT